MALIQEWAAPAAAPTATSVTQTGTATTAGNGLLVRAFIRSSGGNIPANVTITDDAVNSWTLVAENMFGSSFLYLFHAANADPATSVTLNWVEQTTGLPYAEECLVLLSEYSDMGPLIDTSTAVLFATDLPPAITPTATGQLLAALGGTNITSATWTPAGAGVTPTPLITFAGQGIQSNGAYAYTTDGSTPVAIGWGPPNTREFPTINALFDVAGGTPDPDPEPTGRYLLTATGWAPVTTTLL